MVKNTNVINKCKYYESCSAPICPAEGIEKMKKAIWYPDEAICKKRDENGKIPIFVKQQKKIAKIVKKNGKLNVGYFTFDMLNANRKITKAIKGINGDKDEKNIKMQIEKWFKKHPPLKELSIKKKQEFLRRIKKHHKNKKS